MMGPKKVDQKNKCMEIALLHENGTWETRIHDIPESGDSCESVQAWWEKASKEPQYRKILRAVLFNENPESPQ